MFEICFNNDGTCRNHVCVVRVLAAKPSMAEKGGLTARAQSVRTEGNKTHNNCADVKGVMRRGWRLRGL